MNTGTIYVLCPENNRPSGGIKILYRHVDVLNKNGFSAAILHQQQGFRCTWFSNTTRVVYLPEIKLSRSDYLVVPEIYGPNIIGLGNLPQIGHQVKKVIFNQNSYYTFLGYPISAVLNPGFIAPYAKPDEFMATIVVSEDSKRYLEYAFPQMKIYRIRNSINTEVFAYQARKKKQICFMPRKHPEDALQVLAILRARGALNGFSVMAIDNKTEREVAEMMKDSLIFLSFGYPEGYSLPPAEAMACGCIVVGYHGQGGAEYFKPEFCYPIDINDIVGYARTVEELIAEWERNPSSLTEQAMQAAKYVSATYSPECEQNDIVATWNLLIAGRGD